jgi:hypothetical protein
LKNQQRWNFGVLYPPAWAANQTGSDRSYFQMECIALCSDKASLDISVRFLKLVEQEAMERKLSLEMLSPLELAESPRLQIFSLPAEARVSAMPVGKNAVRLRVVVANTSDAAPENRNDALTYSLISAHAVLELRDGEFISQIDPPEDLKDAIAACQNIGVWPVLIGKAGQRDTMLGSPIVLYDYPKVAPESRGDLFDSTEIDEILTLRTLALTDAEKEEVRRSDKRARDLLERLEASPPEHLLELHGTVRRVQQLKKGDRVRLRPRKRADIFDTLLDGKIAIIEAVEEDFEGKVHFAVVLEDDPGRDLGEMHQIGHRFFFSTEEVEPQQ